MKKKWKIGLVTLCAVALVSVTYAASAGSEGDPLVTLSYLKNIFTGQVQEMVKTSVAETKTDMETQFGQAIKDWDAKVSEAVSSSGSGGTTASALYTDVTVSGGKTLTAQSGCEFIFRSGNAAVTIASGSSLIDETMGSVVASGAVLSANHLYIVNGTCTIKTSAASTPSGTVKDGPLNVRSGPGTSYKVQTTLEKGAKVNILGEKSGWYQVSSGSVTGYVLGSYIIKDATAQATSASMLIRGNYSVK